MSTTGTYAEPMTSPSARRRQRSTRLTVAVALLVLAVLLVTGAVISGSFLSTALSSFVALALGAAATKITHTELQQARRDAARDRAELARDYAAVTARRAEENAEFARDMADRITAREHTIGELEQAVAHAQQRAGELTRKMSAEARRADQSEDARRELERALSAAEDRAAEAIVRMAELEQEVDVLKAEVDAWNALASEPVRKRA